MKMLPTLVRMVVLFPIETTRDAERAERSHFIWGAYGPGLWRLTPLGIVNTALRPLGLDVGVRS